MKRTMSKVLSLVLCVALLCTVVPFGAFADVAVLTGQRIELTSPAGEVEVGATVEIPATISNPDGIQGVMLEVTWDPTLLQADATFKLGKYNCFAYPTQNSDGVSIQDQTKTLTVDFVNEGKLIYAGAAGYVFEDYTTPLSAGTFKFKVLEAAKGKNVVVTVSPVSVDADGNVNGGTYATDANMKNVAFDAPVNATIKVAGAAVEPEISGIEVAAGAVEIADADKADEAKIVAAVKAAITAITVKWTEGKEDTTVTADDAEYAVNADNKNVAVTYGGFTDYVAYTVAEPVTPPVTGGVPVLTGQRIELTSPTGEVEVGATVEIPATISNPNGIQGVMLEVTWDPTLLQADATFKLGKYNCFAYPTQNSDGVSIQDQTKTLTVDFVNEGKLIYAGAAGYVFEDYTTPLSAGTFKFKVLEAAKGKDVVVTVSPVSVDADGNVNGGTYATDANMKNVAFDAPVNATIKVAGAAEPEIKYYTVIYKVDGVEVEKFENVAEGTTTPAYEYTAPEGYTFSGFGDIPATVTGDLTFEGTTTVNSYTVTYKVDGEIVHTETVEYGAEIPAYEYEVADGYTFSGFGEIPATMPAEDLVFEGTTEEIVIPTFTVTFQVGDLVVGTITKDEGESVEKTEYPAVQPKEGHTIVWDNEGPITADATVYGTYVANSYTVTYKVDGEVVHTETVVYGAEIPAYEYEVADGYTFSGFGEIPATMPAEDLVFEGTTEEIPATMYTVTFVVMGEVYAEIEVEEGTAIGDLMPEDPEVEAYIFNGWFDGTGEPVDADTIINDEIEVTADFTKDPMDVNGDDAIDSKDSIFLLNHCALPEIYEIAEEDIMLYDFNEDGKVNSKDAVAHFLALALPELYSLR